MTAKLIWPTKAPGMPPVGKDLITESMIRGDRASSADGTGKSYSEEHGEQLEDLIEQILYGGGEAKVKLTVKPGKIEEFTMVSGHLWGRDPDGPSAGPEPADVMVVGKMLGEQEAIRKRCNRGKSGKFLLQTLQKLGVNPARWYVTNLIKTEHLDGDRGPLKASWVKAQIHLLHQEIRLVRPRYLLCLGADAVRYLLGNKMSLGKMQGRVFEWEIPIGETADDDSTHKILVMACQHPAYVMGHPEFQDRMERDLGRFHQLSGGDRWDQDEPDIDHRVVRNELQLERLLKEAEELCGAEGRGKIIGMDAEWNGDHPQSENAYLRTVQISWGHKKAAVLVIHEAGGEKIGFKRVVRRRDGRPRTTARGGKRRVMMTTDGAIPWLMLRLKQFLKDKRLAMHIGNADHEWLMAYGLDLREQWSVPDDPVTFRDSDEGPLDTALMAHSVDETGDFTLTGQTIRYTEAPRYDIPLINWKEAYCREKGIKASALEGYGDCPDDVLYPYANYDADSTRRLALVHLQNLDSDQFGNDCWEPYWMSMQAALPCLEINTTGLLLDKARVDTITRHYMEAKRRLGEQIRTWARWPKLNLESRFEVAELLFGEKYNGHPRDERGAYRRLRPAGAKTVGALPVLTTDKRPKPWEEVLAEKKEDDHTASTNKQVLGMMLHVARKLRVRRKVKNKNGASSFKWVTRDMYEIVEAIRNYRFVSQILKSVLRVPDMNEDEEFIEDDDGNLVYSKGIAGSVCLDDRVRTFISQLKETGRWASSRPPLQNISKRREADYKRIMKQLGMPYLGGLRSIFMADEDYVLVEADYTGAELYGMALMSGDQLMIEHARRNLLPEDHPDFYDMHSNVAVSSFNLPCEPTKKGLNDIDKKHLRIVAKSVIFGVAYGRGAKAIAIAAKEEGVEITEQEAQAVVDTIFSTYPGLVDFFAECRARAVLQEDGYGEEAPRWLCNPFGRFRRFQLTDDRKVAGEMERQAQNFPIQSMIADAVSLAIFNIYDSRRTRPHLDFKIVLQIHDAIILLVHKDSVNEVCEEVLPECMERMVEIYRCRLDGSMYEDSPAYSLGIGLECATHWGVPMFPDECMRMGFKPQHTGWLPVNDLDGGWTNSETFGSQIWLESDQQLHDPEEVFA